MSQITTHVLDTSMGKPAEGIKIVLFSSEDHGWNEIALGTTNADGRVGDLLEEGKTLQPGTYRLVFHTREYFELRSIQAFYPEVIIVFNTVNREHYHVPLLLNPFGYSTYRGS